MNNKWPIIIFICESHSRDGKCLWFKSLFVLVSCVLGQDIQPEYTLIGTRQCLYGSSRPLLCECVSSWMWGLSKALRGTFTVLEKKCYQSVVNLTSIHHMWWRTFDLEHTGLDQLTNKCKQKRAIVLLCCVCSNAFIGIIDPNGPIYRQHPGTFLVLSFHHSVRHSFLAASARASFFFIMISPSSLRHQFITNVTSSLALPWHADLIWAPDVHARRRLCIGLQVLHYHNASSGRAVHAPVHVSSWKISHNPLRLTSLHLAFRQPWKCPDEMGAANMWFRHCRWSPTGPSASRAEVGQSHWNVAQQIKMNFLQTEWWRSRLKKVVSVSIVGLLSSENVWVMTDCQLLMCLLVWTCRMFCRLKVWILFLVDVQTTN